MKYKMIRLLFLIFLTLVGVAIYVAFDKKNQDPSPEISDVATVVVGKTYGQATIGGPFELVDVNNQPRTQADFNGKFMIVYFGYSFCPDICPAALYNMTQAFSELSEKELNQLAPLFISVDPERDTVENLRIYMQNFHPKIIGLTGTDEQINHAKKQYRVYAQKAKPDGTSTDYLIDHSSIVYLMDRRGRFITSFNHQTDPETIIKVIRSALS